MNKLGIIPTVKELIAFTIGVLMVLHQTFYAPQAQIILVAGGIALMGILGSGVAQRALKKLIEE